MRHKLCRSFHPWCPGVKNRCLSPFDSNIACLCQSIEINNNKHHSMLLLESMVQINVKNVLRCIYKARDAQGVKKQYMLYKHSALLFFHTLHLHAYYTGRRYSWEAIRMGWQKPRALTHWGRETHICVSKLTIIVIIWTNAGTLLIRTLGTNFSEILSEIHAFSLKKMHFNISSEKWRPLCLGLNVLITPLRETLI